MAETGWPLIPREVLPAPVKAARSTGEGRSRPSSARRPADGHGRADGHGGADGHRPAEAGRQLAIFAAETAEPSPADLAGLLAGPGRLGRMGGTARVSVPVDAAWRVHVLVKELVRRGLVVSWHPLGGAEDPRSKSADGTAHRVPDRNTGRDRKTAEDRADDEPPEFDPDAVVGGVIGAGSGSGVDVASGAGTGPGVDVASAAGTGSGGVASAAGTGFAVDVSSGAGILSDATRGAAADAAAAGDAQSTADRGRPAAEDADPDSVGAPPGGGAAVFEVRTAYSRRLNDLARSWPPAAGQLFLAGPGLRLWVAAAGRPVDGGYALGLDADADPAVVDAALVRAGLPGTVSDDGRSYLILGPRGVARLAEMVGDRPEEAPADLWPGGVAA